MYHRYGRHGPHAWRRLRNRRSEQHSREVLPLSPTVVVISVYLPVSVNAERILLIMSTDPNEQPRALVDLSGSAAPVASNSQESKKLSPLEIEAKYAAHHYIHRYTRTHKTFLSQEHLRQIADELSFDFIKPSLTTSTDPEEAYNTFVNAFVLWGERYFQEQVQEGKIVDEATGRLLFYADKDKESDLNHDTVLVEPYLTYHAAIRASEVLGKKTQAYLGYLDEVATFVSLYKQEYERHRLSQVQEGELDRQNRSYPFLN